MTSNQSAGGPQRPAISQSKEALLKTYLKRLKDDTKSMTENYTEIVKLSKVEPIVQVSKAYQTEQEQYEMTVRAANIVRAGESLMKLISDIRNYLILNDFTSVNASIRKANVRYEQTMKESDGRLAMVRDDMSAELYELEEEYYTSAYK